MILTSHHPSFDVFSLFLLYQIRFTKFRWRRPSCRHHDKQRYNQVVSVVLCREAVYQCSCGAWWTDLVTVQSSQYPERDVPKRLHQYSHLLSPTHFCATALYHGLGIQVTGEARWAAGDAVPFFTRDLVWDLVSDFIRCLYSLSYARWTGAALSDHGSSSPWWCL